MDILTLLTEHQRTGGIRDLSIHCRCGWVSTNPNPQEHIQHQADLLGRHMEAPFRQVCSEAAATLDSFAETFGDLDSEMKNELKFKAQEFDKRAHDPEGTL